MRESRRLAETSASFRRAARSRAIGLAVFGTVLAHAAIVLAVLALIALLTLIRVPKVAPPTADRGHTQDGQQAQEQLLGQK